MAKAGRPPLDEAEKLRVLHARVSYRMWDDVQELAEITGETQAEVIRQALKVGIDYAKSRRPAILMGKPVSKWVS
jgi:hypothetical protein